MLDILVGLSTTVFAKYLTRIRHSRRAALDRRKRNPFVCAIVDPIHVVVLGLLASDFDLYCFLLDIDAQDCRGNNTDVLLGCRTSSSSSPDAPIEQTSKHAIAIEIARNIQLSSLNALDVD